jgi:hypothetical protein
MLSISFTLAPHIMHHKPQFANKQETRSTVFIFPSHFVRTSGEYATVIEILRAPPHTICVDTRDECYKSQQKQQQRQSAAVRAVEYATEELRE